MNAVLWKLPWFVHDLIRRMTGYRLVRITWDGSNKTEYKWSKKYPMP